MWISPPCLRQSPEEGPILLVLVGSLSDAVEHIISDLFYVDVCGHGVAHAVVSILRIWNGDMLVLCLNPVS